MRYLLFCLHPFAWEGPSWLVSTLCAQLPYGRDIVQMKRDQPQRRGLVDQAGRENKAKGHHSQFYFLLHWNWDLCVPFSSLREPSRFHLGSLWSGANSLSYQFPDWHSRLLVVTKSKALNLQAETNMGHEQQQ